jgi:hypothetical protein
MMAKEKFESRKKAARARRKAKKGNSYKDKQDQASYGKARSSKSVRSKRIQQY